MGGLLVRGSTLISIAVVVLASIRAQAQDAPNAPVPIPASADNPAPSQAAPGVEAGSGVSASPLPRKSWLLVLSPIVGGLKNTIDFKYDVPTGKDETTTREKSMTDTGWGFGLTGVFVWKQLALTNVTFYIPDVNSSRVFGNVLSAHYSLPVYKWVEPAFSVVLVYNRVDATFVNFEDAITKEGVTAVAHFDRFYVKNDIYTLVPKAGLKIRLPIQHWHVKPFVGYMGEWVHVNVHTPGGNVHVPPPVNLDKAIPAISSNKWLDYHSVLVGGELFLDFHYALQLRSIFYYNLSHDTFNLRVIGSAIFSRKVPIGLTTYFEWSEGISHDNLYFFAGPAWMF